MSSSGKRRRSRIEDGELSRVCLNSLVMILDSQVCMGVILRRSGRPRKRSKQRHRESERDKRKGDGKLEAFGLSVPKLGLTLRRWADSGCDAKTQHACAFSNTFSAPLEYDWQGLHAPAFADEASQRRVLDERVRRENQRALNEHNNRAKYSFSIFLSRSVSPYVTV